MRQMFLVLAVAAAGGFALASCGNSSNNGDMGTTDMAGGGGPTLDMSMAKTNCMGVAQCVYTCISGGTDINTCATQCAKNAKAGSATKWNAAVICGQNYCLGDQDMMNGKCAEVPVPGMAGSSLLCDPGSTYAMCSAMGYTSTVCLPCLDQARNIWIYDISVDPANPGPPTGMCSMPTGADCMGAKALCMAQFNACLNDP
jgi:hypothetical protein